MNNQITAWVGWLLLLAALVLYCYSIGLAVDISWGEAPIASTKYPLELASVAATLQTLLLANLGMVLGISISRPGSAIAKNVLIGASNSSGAGIAPPPPLEIRETLQLAAMVVFIISLIVCVVTWAHKGFSSDAKDVLPLISQSGKMFIGVILAYITAILSK